MRPDGAGTGGPVHAHPQRRGHCRRHPAHEELRREHLCRPQALHGHHPDAHRRGPRQRGLQRRQPRARPRDRPPDPRRAGPAPARRAHLRGRAHLGGPLRRQSPEPRQEDLHGGRRLRGHGALGPRRQGPGPERLGAPRRLPAAAAHHQHRGLLHAGQDARRHRPRDGRLSPRGHGRLQVQGGRTHARGGCRAGRGGAPGGGTGFRPRGRRQPRLVRRGRGALRPADRAARHRSGSRSRATGTTTWP